MTVNLFSNQSTTLDTREELKIFLKPLVKKSSSLFKLAKADLVKTYRGAALGWAWAIIKPAVTIFVYWFAFSVGVRVSRDVNGYPYFLWLIGGMMPWFYMRDTIIAGADSIRRYKYLVTKIKYPVSTIPTYVNISQFVINVGLNVIMFAIFMLYGRMPDIYWFQIPFYMILMLLFFNAWSLFAGMLSAMSKDFLNLVKAVVTALFWISGIMYNVNGISIGWIKTIMLFNPITIIVNGFRNSLIYKEWFWENTGELVNFAIMYALMLILAIWSYRKLRKEIPDVL